MKVEIEIEPREVRFLIERSDACNSDYRKRLLDSWKRYDRKGRAKRKEILILLRIVDQLVRDYEKKKVASDVL